MSRIPPQELFDLNRPRSLADSPAYATAAELSSALKEGRWSCREVTSALLKRIETWDPQVRAWEYLDPELAFRNAAAIDERRESGVPLGELAGVPVGIKDVFNTADMPTGMGSELWKGFTPGNDARTIYNLRRQDALMLGKTVTAEFAVHYLAAEKTLNPHHPGHIPGTSSSGSAAAVAAYMAPLALGTQTAGSIVRPASFCGVMGFKPTFGTIARTGVLKTTDTLDTIGTFARTIGDLERSFNVLRVHGRDYPLVHERLKRVGPDFRPRVGFLRDGVHVFRKFPAYAMEALAAMEEQAFRLLPTWKAAPVQLPAMVDLIHGWHESIYDKTLSYYFKQESQHFDRISANIQQIIERGNQVSIQTYQTGLEHQAEAREAVTEALQDVDVLLTLSTAGEAPKLGVLETPDTCLIWTFLGFPALSLPLFRSPNGLPFGLQLVAKRYDDYKLLMTAQQLLTALSPGAGA